jgi:arginyl-tRNA synthetase
MNPENVKNLIHYSYEIVDLTGYKMSRRRGRYITLDEVLSEAINRARDEVEKRSPHLSVKMKTEIAKIVGIGAVKYALISVVPQKKVTFTWDKVLNFDVNSAPFIQYAHARACSIIEKAEKTVFQPDFSQLKNPIEWQIILKVALFPTVFINAAENLAPVLLSEYANELASKFNSFYASIPVLKADTNSVIDARLMLVNGVRITLKNALMLLGIEAPETM